MLKNLMQQIIRGVIRWSPIRRYVFERFICDITFTVSLDSMCSLFILYLIYARRRQCEHRHFTCDHMRLTSLLARIVSTASSGARCELLIHMSRVAWFLCVCRSRPWALQKHTNLSKSYLECT